MVMPLPQVMFLYSLVLSLLSFPAGSSPFIRPSERKGNSMCSLSNPVCPPKHYSLSFLLHRLFILVLFNTRRPFRTDKWKHHPNSQSNDTAAGSSFSQLSKETGQMAPNKRWSSFRHVSEPLLERSVSALTGGTKGLNTMTWEQKQDENRSAKSAETSSETSSLWFLYDTS